MQFIIPGPAVLSKMGQSQTQEWISLQKNHIKNSSNKCNNMEVFELSSNRTTREGRQKWKENSVFLQPVL